MLGMAREPKKDGVSRSPQCDRRSSASGVLFESYIMFGTSLTSTGERYFCQLGRAVNSGKTCFLG